MTGNGRIPTFAEVHALGYRDLVPVEPRDKAVLMKGWQHYRPGPADLDRWQRQGKSIGIRTGKSLAGDEVLTAVDADALDPALAESIRSTLLEATGLDESALAIRIGQPPKALYLFQSPPGRGIIGGKIQFSDPGQPENDKPGEVEVRTNWLQFVAFGVHPKTGQPYSWPNGFLKLADLPVITQPQVERFLALLRERTPQSRGRAGGGNPAENQASLRGTLDLVADALKWIPNKRSTRLPDGATLDYHGWVSVAYAIKAALGEGGLPLFELFSEKWQDGAYDAKTMRSTWKGAKGPFRIGAAWLYEAAALNSKRKFSKFAALAAETAEEKAPVAARRPNGADLPEGDDPPDYLPEPPVMLEEVHTLFRKWLSAGYDTDTIDAVLAAAAAHALGGDPLWILVISGPGNAKTETVSALAGAGAHVTSTIASEGALLSASPKKGRVKTATGGLLRKIGNDGILVVKDFTSILSMDRNIRGTVLAAMREIYDGKWERNVGTDGGQTLTWTGRITVIAAVTTAWDAAHSVISSMGDRFVVIRADSTDHRSESGRQAIRNTGQEVGMRAALAKAVGALLAAAKPDGARLAERDEEKLLALADVVTFARTAVETDYRGDVLDAHAPEMPTRFAKQLFQVVRGAEAIGLDHAAAMRLAMRCAHDSMPPFRLQILCDIAEHPDATTLEIRNRINKPLSTVKQRLQALQVLGLLNARKAEGEGETKVWRWSLGRLLNGEGLALLREIQKREK